jgi:hypothetical protein
MGKEYDTYEQACRYRRRDETTILDINTKKYRNIKLVNDPKPYEYEVNRPG